METAKVDIRRLQLLNDRINQCLDALNQVRLSVHGLSHSAFPTAFNTLGPEAQAFPYPQMPQVPQTLAQDPRFTTGFAPPTWGAGLAHSAGGYGPTLGAFGTMTGIGGAIPQGFGPLGVGPTSPFGSPPGLQHSSPEMDPFGRAPWGDPYLAARVSQTFPYARFAVPPAVALY